MIFDDAETLLNYAENLGIKFTPNGSQLDIDAPKKLLTPELIKYIKQYKNEILLSLHNYDFTEIELKEKCGGEWQELITNRQTLRAFANALYKQKIMEQSLVPPNYTHSMICVHCGIVPCPPEFEDGKEALGCPWCFIRAQGLPIPTPKTRTY